MGLANLRKKHRISKREAKNIRLGIMMYRMMKIYDIWGKTQKSQEIVRTIEGQHTLTRQAFWRSYTADLRCQDTGRAIRKEIEKAITGELTIP